MPILPDVLAPGLDVVFCGTAPGEKSARAGAYYAGPGNQFWPVLYRTGLTPYQLAPAEFRLMPTFGLGLTDLVKEHYGQDEQLPKDAFDSVGLRQKIVDCAPKILAFTSKRAAKEFLGRAVAYGWQEETIGTTKIYVLPSTSGQARRFWQEGYWQALAQTVRVAVDKVGSGDLKKSD
ncbi:mismatch-specific DNA-glycosylase [Heliophilum fasciatum]|uniref:G/U mismatch-specific uracil-DNA glycosylase n=1 Tax=Heliophilum fasciatum TaxID=35700 RepID=A0A4R2RLC2_9FIRM|nr:mismatch-specific DNA-glycosylase [Heliophilum fasciatum]MCW2278300.1 TDG/mug DNA glycosylase family protein [Heliophilum fasciatum]TCP63923.1 G/U mismatch-specific uracil-DNA glycosylase [Heliophilum fasciatum]